MKRTRNQTLVYDYLEAHGKPASAYDILDALRNDELRAPLQVYRALRKLVEAEAVHRIKSLNACVACNHINYADSRVSIFMLCYFCEEVTEISGTCRGCAGASH